MTWVNPPPTVVQFRNQLLLCPSVTGAPWNMTSSEFHYPTMNPSQISPNQPTFDLMPCAVLADVETERERYAEGAVPLINGDLVATFYIAQEEFPTWDVGTLETQGRQILSDMGAQYFGLSFKRSRIRLASDPKPGQQGDNNSQQQQLYRTFSLHFTYGLSRSR
jgi:hypothetical protein